MSETFVDLAIDSSGDTLEVDTGGDSLLAYLIGASPPSAPTWDEASFQQALLALMPRGRAWPKSLSSVQAKTLGAFAGTLVRVCLAAAQLMRDAFPPTTVNLIDDWEESLGLPDPCAGESPLLAVRQAAIVARFAGLGGQSVPYFEGLAATLGYQITITEFTGANAHKWQVNVADTTLTYFRAGSSGAGEPLISGITPDVLECVFRELRPAQTTVEFNLT